MNAFKKKYLVLVLSLSMFGVATGMFATTVSADAPLLRVYNPNSGEHHYTIDVNERNHLVKVGWRNEGTAWQIPEIGFPVHRLYNPNNGGDHHYTLDTNERDHLTRVGWRYEGTAWNSNGDYPVYRLYNPNAKTGSHHYTLHAYERDDLVRAGWRYEGIAFYSSKSATDPAPRYTVWYTPDNSREHHNDIANGINFFKSYAEAEKWIKNYSNESLAQGIKGTYGVTKVSY